MKLPRLIDPRKLANQGSQLQGSMPSEEMARLSGAVVKVVDVQVELDIHRDEERHAVIDGEYRLAVDMTCQRCMQPVRQNIEGELHVGVVWDENQAAALPGRLDPWIVETESADVYPLIEDEFLLSLPIVPYHDESECPATGHYSTGEHEEARKNPFSVLAKLKK